MYCFKTAQTPSFFVLFSTVKDRHQLFYIGKRRLEQCTYYRQVNISHVKLFECFRAVLVCPTKTKWLCDNLPPFEDDLPLEIGKGISIRGSGNHKPSK